MAPLGGQIGSGRGVKSLLRDYPRLTIDNIRQASR
jgi:uncharacterized protein (DUF433 family)